MLDVHPPHSPTHTWKDFFIHIATIVVGLLIAIGLEQTVEHIHQRNEVVETREALRIEHDNNVKAYAQAISEFHRQSAALINNLAVLLYLQQHPGTPESRLPGILVWHGVRGSFSDSAWKTAQQGNITSLMPPDEVRRYDTLYRHIGDANRTFDEVWPAIIEARLYGILDSNPSHMSAPQIAREIDLTKAVMAKHFAQSAALVQLSRADPGFAPSLTPNELNKIMRIVEVETNPDLAEAIAATNHRLPAESQLPMPAPVSTSANE